WLGSRSPGPHRGGRAGVVAIGVGGGGVRPVRTGRRRRAGQRPRARPVEVAGTWREAGAGAWARSASRVRAGGRCPSGGIRDFVRGGPVFPASGGGVLPRFVLVVAVPAGGRGRRGRHRPRPGLSRWPVPGVRRVPGTGRYPAPVGWDQRGGRSAGASVP